MSRAQQRAQGDGSSESVGWGFRWLILATTVTTYALVVLGGVVRATESGDACPDWPRCQGELIPPFETAVIIEFSHRLLASVVGFLVLAVAIAALRSQRRSLAIFWGSLAAVGLVGGQIVLGGMTVLNDLPSSMVMAHLALASALLATLLFVAVAAFTRHTSNAPARLSGAVSFRNLAVFAALATFGLMLTGSYVTGSGAGLAFNDWPLFDGRLMPEGGRLAMIHATHRFAAIAIGLLLAFVAWQAWRDRRLEKGVVHGSMFAFVLYLAQAMVGAANIWTTLQPAASAAHLALAVLLWATLVVVALYAHRSAQEAVGVEPERRPEPASGPAMEPAPSAGGSS